MVQLRIVLSGLSERGFNFVQVHHQDVVVLALLFGFSRGSCLVRSLLYSKLLFVGNEALQVGGIEELLVKILREKHVFYFRMGFLQRADWYPVPSFAPSFVQTDVFT